MFSIRPPPARAGLSDWSKPTYGGPCPPIGRHRYFFKLYALDIELPEIASPTKAAVEKAIAALVNGLAIERAFDPGVVPDDLLPRLFIVWRAGLSATANTATASKRTSKPTTTGGGRDA